MKSKFLAGAAAQPEARDRTELHAFRRLALLLCVHFGGFDPGLAYLTPLKSASTRFPYVAFKLGRCDFW